MLISPCKHPQAVGLCMFAHDDPRSTEPAEVPAADHFDPRIDYLENK